MISALCEFEHIAAEPEGPEVWVELSEEIDRIQMTVTCEELKGKLNAVATDTVLRHEEAIDCYGRAIHRGDVCNPSSRAYQAMLDAMVCMVAVRDIDPMLRGALLNQMAVIAADLRGVWKWQD